MYREFRDFSGFERVYELERMIRMGRLGSIQEAAAKFDVTERTIKRDLDRLRGLGADVRYDRSRRVFEYRGAPATLPAQWLTNKDIALILIAEKALRLYTGAFPEHEVHPVFNRFLDPVRHDKDIMEHIYAMCGSVVFHRPFTPERNVHHDFTRILNAVMDNQRIAIAYRDAGGALTERELDPYALYNSGGDWYVVGKCRLRNRVQSFALDRVFNPRLVDAYFSVPQSFDINTYLAQGFGRMRGGKNEQVRLRIYGQTAHWVSRTIWHGSQKIRKNKDKSITLSMMCPVTDGLVRWVMQMQGDVTVLEPGRLRKRIVDAASGMMERNGGRV